MNRINASMVDDLSARFSKIKDRINALEQTAEDRELNILRSDMRKEGLVSIAHKFVCPALFAIFGFYCQSVFLHYATYSYVQRMMKFTSHERASPKFAVMPDPFEASLGKQEVISLPILDTAAGFFPAFFVVVSCLHPIGTLQVWTKVMVCAGFLFIIKGALGAMTTVPDSSGWHICEERLKTAGLDWMKQTHSLWDMFFVDFHWVVQYRRPLRYCSDMLYSGHTFVVTLFALGSYELLRVVLHFHRGHIRKFVAWAGRKIWPAGLSGKGVERCVSCVKLVMFFSFGLLAIGEQCVEIYFVLLSHFHYTMDVAVALVMTFLLYTNSAIALFTKKWEFQGFYAFTPWRRPFPKTLLPIHDQESRFRREEMWVSKGDVYVPICCFPFCLMHGRGHMYTDDGILSIVEQSFLNEEYIRILVKELEKFGDYELRPTFLERDGKHKIFKVMEDMNFAEGVSWADVKCIMGAELDKREQLKVELDTGSKFKVVADVLTSIRRMKATGDQAARTLPAGFLSRPKQGETLPEYRDLRRSF